ncbi:hypothetical protein EPO66_05760 [bacterium]|nr:MAG: hypothetical protein EPO66_05760 [bacterium]
MDFLSRTKRKLREAEQHLSLLKNAVNLDETEGYFSAFLAASRTVTLALQKDLKDKPGFERWYKAKQDEMRNDQLCKFFKNLRDKDLHTGDSDIESSTFVPGPINTRTWPNRPKNSGIKITSRGIYWVLNSGTLDEKEINVNVSNRINFFRFPNPPQSHLGRKIKDKTMQGLCCLFLDYLSTLYKEAIVRFNKNS